MVLTSTWAGYNAGYTSEVHNFLSLKLGIGHVLSFASTLLLDIFFRAHYKGNLLAKNGDFAHKQMTQRITPVTTRQGETMAWSGRSEIKPKTLYSVYNAPLYNLNVTIPLIGLELFHLAS